MEPTIPTNKSAYLNNGKSEKDAARKIERNWCCYRDRQMFKLLKYAVCAAEHSLTYEVLRKVSPSEADLLKDPVFQPKIKFRFAGADFPPYIIFKVYIQSDGKGLKYMSGKKVIKPATKAAVDACKQMGNRKYYDQMIRDSCQAKKDKITDEIDVTNLQEYMQYLKNTDEMPASLGGKDNSWRKLSLEALPRHNIMYDVMAFLNSGTASPRLKSEMPHIVATTRPSTQENQVELLQKVLEEKRQPHTIERLSGRRTKRAKERVAKMRRMYGLENEQSSRKVHTPNIENYDDNDDYDDAWEEEAKFLYEWTQELSMDTFG